MLSCTDFLMACDTASLFATTIHLFYFPHSYHKLLVTKYGCKREKSQEAKWRSAEEWRPIHEMEKALDVDLFLGAQDQWAEDRPHCLTILHEMFLHAGSEGQKEVEWYVCQGIWWQMHQLNGRYICLWVQLGGTPRYLLGGLQAVQVTQLPTRRTGHFEGGISCPPLPFNGGRRQS